MCTAFEALVLRLNGWRSIILWRVWFGFVALSFFAGERAERFMTELYTCFTLCFPDRRVYDQI